MAKRQKHRSPFLPGVRPRLAAVLLILLVTAALALLSRELPALASRLFQPTGGAQWIWAERHRDDASPAAFYAVRDFDLEAPPERARLLVTADPEYVLHLNGKRVGSGEYAPGAGLDVYEVGPLLLPGGNRLVVELRSERGSGGLLASLVDGTTGDLLVGTDARWRVVRRQDPGLVRGWLSIADAEPAHSWGYPPAGRWGPPKEGREKPLFSDLVGRPVPPASARPVPVLGGTGTLLDWGREVVGYLSLDVKVEEEMGTALVFTGGGPPNPLAVRPDTVVLVAPGARRWLDSRPRRFRYALVLGLERPATARLLPLAPGLDAKTAAGLLPPASDGENPRVFGIEAPPLRTPVEDKIWGELQGVPGVALRKEL
ncbi:MAG TPA: hypothetical protein VJ725_06035 [Thermoanaerobaculia bacterium]|nr:hypothetical protein [Thermoanaerobaculia bacterium]